MMRSRPTRYLILGATAGLATPVCRLLAARGAKLYLVARNPEKLSALAHELGPAVVGSATADLDVLSRHDALLTEAARALGHIDSALIAHGVLGDYRQIDPHLDRVLALLHTNLTSIISLSLWLADYFEKQGTGQLAVFSSVVGDRGRMAGSAYGASKAGLTNWLTGLRGRLYPSGVNVLTIKPGPVRTPMTQFHPLYSRFADPDSVARQILRALDRRKDVLYTPHFWRVLMFIARNLPESIVKRIKF